MVKNHRLLPIEQIIHGQEHIKVSRINLIDLAGSERSSVAQTSVERLKVTPLNSTATGASFVSLGRSKYQSFSAYTWQSNFSPL